MPAWIVSALISLALKFGLPFVLDWLHKKFPWWPVGEETKKVISDLVDSLKQTKAQQRAAKRVAARKLRACHGIACPAELVRE